MNTGSLESLNDRQREAVTTVDGAVLVIAGAGSGKTRVLTERIAHLLRDHGVAPWEVLAFTFTNRAAREMKDRLERLVPGATEAMWVGTFHATGVRILRRHGEAIGVRRDFTIYDADDALNLVKTVMQRDAVAAQAARSPRALRDRISRFKNDLVTPAMALERAAHGIDERVARLYAQYEKELRRANALDFDDLIARVVELFGRSDAAREHYARRFRYILVDEFQDTNAIQMAMIRELASHHGNLFVVGDDDQSIYSWRGARVEHILEFERLYPEARVIRLEQNYRSTQTILDAANHVIAHNRGRRGKTLWTDGPRGEPIRLVGTLDEEAEAVTVVQTVRAWREAGVPLREIAVLYRTNAQSRALEDVLKMSAMPYQIIGGVRFYERMEVRDVLAWCKVLVNPADIVNMRRIVNVPRRGIGRTTVDRLETAALERDTTMVEVMRTGAGVAGAAQRRCAEFLKLFDRLREVVATEVAPVAVERIVEETGYLDHLREHYPDSESRIENVEEVVAAAQGYAESAEDPSLRAFLEEVALVADVDALDEEAGALTLMTLHNAKGLEFDAVIITGLEDGLFPHFNSLGDASSLEEERRLFYVGMTRARHHLVLTFAGMRRRLGQVEGLGPSRFLEELPEGCLEGDRPPGDAVPDVRSAMPWGAGGARRRVRPAQAEDVSQELPAAMAEADFDQEGGGWRVGMRVRHASFGAGVIRRVEGSGEATRVVVIFDSGRERKLLVQYAPLQPL